MSTILGRRTMAVNGGVAESRQVDGGHRSGAGLSHTPPRARTYLLHLALPSRVQHGSWFPAAPIPRTTTAHAHARLPLGTDFYSTGVMGKVRGARARRLDQPAGPRRILRQRHAASPSATSPLLPYLTTRYRFWTDTTIHDISRFPP